MTLTSLPENASYSDTPHKTSDRQTYQPKSRFENDNAPTPPLGTPDPARRAKPPRLSDPLLMSEQELAHHILRAEKEGADYPEISARFNCSDAVITQARSLYRLHPKLMLAFINEAINLDLAAALSSIPNHQAQYDLMLQLGPYARKPSIIKAIAEGDTVLELPNGDILIVPSRAPKPHPSHQSPSLGLFNSAALRSGFFLPQI